ncbi:ELP4 (YPL101W) [Zygosaccharomyces parabailii]|nr:ELP4 (YPL101W) [Zygosaccharomyces parabailii]CDH12371.1 related to Elongator complex protein 4 [Zygosaccharomyces bailii ISA1307]
MSFRKRGDVLRGGVNVRSDGRSQTGRVVPGRESPARKSTTDNITLPTRQLAKLGVKESFKSDHPGVRPSPATSQQTTSTGSQDLDRLLGHMGLPLGNSLLVEEKTTTEFNSILCKIYAAQGIVHNRVEPTKIGNTHLIVVTLNQGFSKELPGVYKGSRKDVKRSKIAEEESKLTVQNLAEHGKPSRQNDLKIAWRYKLTDEDSTKGINALPSEEYQKYSNQFDITTRLMPAPTPQEISFVSPVQPSQTVLSQIERIITQNEGKLIRILVPSLLHPAMYPPPMFKLSGVIPLIHGLKGLIKKHQDRCVLLATLSSDMLSDLVVAQAENLFDAVLSLEPFEQDMLRFLEKAYKSQPNKVQHGLVHVLKLPVFSERGEMRVAKSEYAFKNGRKRFEIEEWGIPVEDEDDGALRTQSEIKNTGSAENSSRNTTIPLDF